MTDQCLLARYVHVKDHKAFKTLVVKYQGLVYAACKRHLNNNADIEDVSQQVFIALMENAHQVDTNLGGWLHRCATNKAISMVRSEVARKRRELTQAVEDRHDDQSTVWIEIRDIIDKCLSQLRPVDKEIIIQSILLQKPQATIAQSMGVSQQAIAKRASKALTKLRMSLRHKGVIVSAVTLITTLKKHAVAATVPAKLTALLTHTTTKWAAAISATTAGGGIGVTTKLKVGAVVVATTLLVVAPHDQLAPITDVNSSANTAMIEVMPTATINTRPVSTAALASPVRNRWIATYTTSHRNLSVPVFNPRGQVNGNMSAPPLVSLVSQPGRLRSSAMAPQVDTQTRAPRQPTAVQTNPPGHSGRVVLSGDVVRARKRRQKGVTPVRDQASEGLEDLHDHDSVIVQWERLPVLEDETSHDYLVPLVPTDNVTVGATEKLEEVNAQASPIRWLAESRSNQDVVYRVDSIQFAAASSAYRVSLIASDQNPIPTHLGDDRTFVLPSQGSIPLIPSLARSDLNADPRAVGVIDSHDGLSLSGIGVTDVSAAQRHHDFADVFLEAWDSSTAHGRTSYGAEFFQRENTRAAADSAGPIAFNMNGLADNTSLVFPDQNAANTSILEHNGMSETPGQGPILFPPSLAGLGEETATRNVTSETGDDDGLPLLDIAVAASTETLLGSDPVGSVSGATSDAPKMSSLVQSPQAFAFEQNGFVIEVINVEPVGPMPNRQMVAVRDNSVFDSDTPSVQTLENIIFGDGLLDNELASLSDDLWDDGVEMRRNIVGLYPPQSFWDTSIVDSAFFSFDVIAVPEPSTFAVLTIGATIFLKRRK